MATIPSNTYHHGDLKSALIQAAAKLVKDKGIEALSLRNIASEVGVSHMAPYSHFKNKSELFQSVATSGFIELGDRMTRIKQDLVNPKELILLYGVEYINFASSNPQLYKLMLSQTHPKNSMNDNVGVIEASPIQVALEHSSKKPYQLLRDGFAALEKDEIKVSVQAQGAWSMVHGIASLIITGHIVIDETMGVKQFLSIATQGMTTTSNM